MTDRDVSTQDTAVAVQVRTDGDVDDEALAYFRAKVHAALTRPGLPALRGRVTISRAAAHQVLPWSAGAEVRVGGHLVVVRLREADAHALADRLEDRLRARVDRAVHLTDTARRSAGPPPWRGGATRGDGSRGSFDPDE
ncbi:hypothetical protein [Streptomyces canus]|uniref:hypothetical protein n=1 Tax=Streptomyces canus TaxID=58343 RepID=UPI002DD86520|nr:hypothetical protein [Streptomyces canus]WSD91407.1 hypothetical protein OG925_47090 [Streptomyces canus]